MERVAGAADGLLASSWQSSGTTTDSSNYGTPGAANSAAAANTAPQAVISGSSEGLTGEELVWSGEGSSDAEDDELEYVWDFGDGASGADMEVMHTYSEAGIYAVVLTVRDSAAAEDQAQIEVTVTAPTYSDTVVINEFLPNPVGSDSAGEFVELKNTGDEEVDLEGWQIDDEEGGSTPYTIGEGVVLAAGQIKSFGRTETGIALNNNGDKVRLLDPAGEVRSSYSYDSATEGWAYARDDDGSLVETTTPTPGEENVITVAEEEEEEEGSGVGGEDKEEKEEKKTDRKVKKVELKKVRGEEKGTIVEVIGVVSVPPGVFGTRYVYLAGSGIQLYFHKGAWPQLKLGDKVRMVGEVSAIRGEARLKLAAVGDIKVLSGGEPPVPVVVKTEEVDEELEGSLVTVQGRVSKTSGDTFYVDDGSGEVKVYIKPTVKIDKPRMKKGMAVMVTGVVSETSSGYRILPRWQEDLRVGVVAGMQSFPATGGK